MRKIICIFTFVVSILTCVTAISQERFSLSKRINITTNNANNPKVIYIYSILDSLEVKSPLIKTRKALSLKVNTTKELIEEGIFFEVSKKEAIITLYENLSNSSIEALFKECVVRDEDGKLYLINRREPCFIDITTTQINKKTLLKRLKKESDIYITIFSNNGIGVSCNTITNNTNCTEEWFYKPKAITPKELGGIVVDNKDKSITIITELLLDNNLFRESTGHKINSDEGMRFIDDIFKNTFYQTDINKIRIITDFSNIEIDRFINPLKNKLERNGAEIEIIKEI